MEIVPGQQTLSIEGLNSNYAQDVKLFNNYLLESGLDFKNALQSYFTEIINKYRPSTIARKKQALKAAIKSQLGQGLSLGQIAQINAFFEEIKIPTPKKQITTDQTISEKELQELITVSGKKTALIIRALYSTACRISELVNIKLSDCTEKKDGVSIRIIGKGRKERTVYLDITLFNEIRNTYQGNTFLFETAGGEPVNRITAYTLIKRAGKKIGRPDIHPHTVRHSFATNRLKELGIDTIGAYLGHSKISTTAQYYLHNIPELKTILRGAL